MESRAPEEQTPDIQESDQPPEPANIATSDEGEPTLDNRTKTKLLIEKGMTLGYVTREELDEVLPQDSSDTAVTKMMTVLAEKSIEIVEGPVEQPIAEPDDKSQQRGLATTTPKTSALDRTDDPTRIYLREMGTVELLSREGEIAIAKRIEAGRRTMISGLCECP